MSYDREKNPFNDPDDDEFGFSKPKYTVHDNYGASTDPFAFAEERGGNSMSKYEQLQQRKENSMNNQLESTQRALSSIYDSEAMGIATAEELVQQGEQLDNVDTKLDKINQDMKTSQKHLTSIKSVFGGIKNWWKGDKSNQQTNQPDKRTTATSGRLMDAMEDSRESGAMSGSTHPAYRWKTDDGRALYEEDDLDSQFLGAGSRRYDRPDARQQGRAGEKSVTSSSQNQQPQMMRSGMAAQDKKLDDNLDLMSEGMSRLKGLAIGLGSEIERQNDQIDNITSKADRADIKLTDQNRQMRQILR